MDTRSMPFNELTRDNFEIVGLNGQPNGYLGYSLPIARFIPNNLFCILSYTRQPDVKFDSQPVIQEMAQLGRITLFEKPIPIPETISTQPIVSWISSSLLSILEQPNWIENPPEITQSSRQEFACEPEQKINDLFKGYADAFCNLFDLSLSKVQTQVGSQAWAHLQQIATIGLQAERDLAKRYWAYVRVGVSYYFNPFSRPEISVQLYRGAVKPVFKNISWDHFLNDMTVIFTRSQKINILTVPLRLDSDPLIDKLHRQVWQKSKI